MSLRQSPSTTSLENGRTNSDFGYGASRDDLPQYYTNGSLAESTNTNHIGGGSRFTMAMRSVSSSSIRSPVAVSPRTESISEVDTLKLKEKAPVPASPAPTNVVFFEKDITNSPTSLSSSPFNDPGTSSSVNNNNTETLPSSPPPPALGRFKALVHKVVQLNRGIGFGPLGLGLNPNYPAAIFESPSSMMTRKHSAGSSTLAATGGFPHHPIASTSSHRKLDLLEAFRQSHHHQQQQKKAPRLAVIVPALKALTATQILTEHGALVRHLQFSPNGEYCEFVVRYIYARRRPALGGEDLSTFNFGFVCSFFWDSCDLFLGPDGDHLESWSTFYDP